MWSFVATQKAVAIPNIVLEEDKCFSYFDNKCFSYFDIYSTEICCCFELFLDFIDWRVIFSCFHMLDIRHFAIRCCYLFLLLKYLFSVHIFYRCQLIWMQENINKYQRLLLTTKWCKHAEAKFKLLKLFCHKTIINLKHKETELQK